MTLQHVEHFSGTRIQLKWSVLSLHTHTFMLASKKELGQLTLKRFIILLFPSSNNNNLHEMGR